MEKEELTINTPANILAPETNYNIRFFTDNFKTEVGKLSWENNVLSFNGNVEESSLIFFECLAKNMNMPFIDKNNVHPENLELDNLLKKIYGDLILAKKIAVLSNNENYKSINKAIDQIEEAYKK